MLKRYVSVVLICLVLNVFVANCGTTTRTTSKKIETARIERKEIQSETVKADAEVSRQDEVITIDIQKKVSRKVEETPVEKHQILKEKREVDSGRTANAISGVAMVAVGLFIIVSLTGVILSGM